MDYGFACPYCNRELIDLKCPPCNFKGKLEDGIYHLHRSDNTWEVCSDQADKLETCVKARYNLPKVAEARNNPTSNANVVGEFTRVKEAIKFFYPLQDKVILDSGGGSIGRVGLRFAENGAKIVFSIDSRLIQNKSKDNYVAVLGDVYHLPFLNNYFDVIVDAATMHHLIDKLSYLKEVYRSLKVGGTFYSYGSAPVKTPERFVAMQGHQKWWFDNYGVFELAWNIEECEKVFKDVFGKPINITHHKYCNPDGTETGLDGVLYIVKG